MRRLLLSAALLTACATAIPAPAGAADDPDYGRPEVGACRDLTFHDVEQEADPSPSADCAKTHTARTIAVKDIPADTDRRDPDVITRLGRSRCTPAWEKAVGGTARASALAAYGEAWFVPTPGEWRHGARWIRCDLILLAGHHLAPLPTDRTPALRSGRIGDDVRRCLVGRDAVTTVCARTHQWRSTGAFTLHQRRYPANDAAAQRTIQRRCDRLTTTRRFRWTYPGEWAWRQGIRTIACYDKTRR